jgi:hypothetical protein
MIDFDKNSRIMHTVHPLTNSLIKPKLYISTSKWAEMLTFCLPNIVVLIKILSSIFIITLACFFGASGWI